MIARARASTNKILSAARDAASRASKDAALRADVNVLHSTTPWRHRRPPGTRQSSASAKMFFDIPNMGLRPTVHNTVVNKKHGTTSSTQEYNSSGDHALDKDVTFIALQSKDLYPPLYLLLIISGRRTNVCCLCMPCPLHCYLQFK